MVRALLGSKAVFFAGVASVIACFPATPCATTYNPPPLSRMISEADVIVTGTITSVTNDQLQILVAETLRGDVATSEVVTVDKERRLRGFERWTPYAPGQTSAFLLTRGSGRARHDGAQSTDSLTITGSAGEGENPITGDSVILQNTGSIPGLPLPKPYVVFGRQLSGLRVSTADFADAIRQEPQLREFVHSAIRAARPHNLKEFSRTAAALRDLPRLQTLGSSPVHKLIVEGAFYDLNLAFYSWDSSRTPVTWLPPDVQKTLGACVSGKFQPAPP